MSEIGQVITALRRYDDGLVKLALSKSGFTRAQQESIQKAMLETKVFGYLLDGEKKSIANEVIAKGVKRETLEETIKLAGAQKNYTMELEDGSRELKAYNRELLKTAILQAAERDNISIDAAEVDKMIDGVFGSKPKKKIEGINDLLILTWESLKKIVKGIGSFIASHPILAGITAAITTTALTFAWANRQIEKASEAAAEVSDKWSELQNTISNNRSAINGFAQDFATLSVGVGKNGENIGLTNDEFERYNDIANQIADMFPQMIEGYTDLGNAIISCKGNIGELNDALDDQQEKYYNDVIDGADTIFKKWNGKWLAKAVLRGQTTDGKARLLESYRDIAERIEQDGTVTGEDLSLVYDELQEDLGMGPALALQHLASNGELTAENLHKVLAVFRESILDLENELAEDLTNMHEIAMAYLNLDTIYQDFMPDTQATIQKYVNNLDEGFFEGFDKKTELKKWLQDNLLTPIDEMTPEMREKFRTALDYFVDNDIDLQDLDVNLFDEYGEAIDFLKAKLESGEKVDWDALYADPNNPALKQFIDMLLSIGFIKEPTEEAMHAIARAIAGVELSTIDAIDSISDKHFAAIEQLKKNALTTANGAPEVAAYRAVMEEAKQAGVDLSKTVYGNVDTNNRQALVWTHELVKENKEALESLGIATENLIGTTSTVLGGYGNYNGVDVAYTPLLQTSNGPVLLSQETVDKYIYELFRVTGKRGELTAENLLAIDAKGLRIDGQVVQGIIAGIGEAEAKAAATSMHYVGKLGEVQLAYQDVEEAAKKAGVSTRVFLTNGDGFVDWMELYNTNEYVKKFIDEMLVLKGIAEPTTEVIREIAEELAGLSSANGIAPEPQTYTEFYESVKEELEVLSGAYKKLRDGERLTVDETTKLLNKYPDLAKYYDAESHQLKITTAQLREKIDAYIGLEEATKRAAQAEIQSNIYKVATKLGAAENRGDDEAAKQLRAELAQLKTDLATYETQIALLHSAADEIYTVVEEIEKKSVYVQMYEKVKDKIDLLSNAYEKLAKEQALSVDEVIDLLDKYPDLIEYYNAETGQLELTVELIREKVDATLAAEKASLEAAKSTAEGLLKEAEAAYTAASAVLTLAVSMETLKGISNDIYGTSDLPTNLTPTVKDQTGELLGLEAQVRKYKQQIEDLTKKLAVLGQIGNSVFELDDAEDEAEKLREKINDWFSDMEFKVELQFNAGKIDVAADMYQQMIDRANQHLSEAYASGMTIDDDWVQELIGKVNTYKKALADLRINEYDKLIEYNDSFDVWNHVSYRKLDVLEDKLAAINEQYLQGLLNYQEWYEAFLDTAGAIYDIQREALDELLDTTMDAIKEDNDAQIEALEEQADAYSKIIDLKKKLLEDTRDEADYEREIAKRTREIAKLQERITQLALDDSREAAAERAALEEELYEKQQELA